MARTADGGRAAAPALWLAARHPAYSTESIGGGAVMDGDNDDDDDDDDDSKDGGPDGSDAHFMRCWRRQDCKACLGQPACSWCPFSAVCVPNGHRIPALAPAWDGDRVCPHWAERWELRTRPLGCQVSTITSLTALVAALGTLAVALLALLAWPLGRRVAAWMRRRGQPDGPRGPGSPGQHERAPLLAAGVRGHP